MLIAEDADQARRVFLERRPGAVLIDYMLGEDDGLKLGLEFQTRVPSSQIILMTGGGLSDAEVALCMERDIPILFKPFLAHEVLNLVNGCYREVSVTAIGAVTANGLKGRADPAQEAR